MKIFVVNGFPGSGKTTFEGIVGDTIGWHRCLAYSSVSFVKIIAQACGWNGEKTPKDRKFLSDLKDLLTEWDDVPYKKMKEVIDRLGAAEKENGGDELIVFIDIREPDEIARICEDFDAKSVLIMRPDVESKEQSNHADEQILNYEDDCVIYNGTDLEGFKEAVNGFIENEIYCINDIKE